MPRFQTLTAGMKLPQQQSPTAIRTNKFEKAQEFSRNGSQISMESADSVLENKSSWDQEKANKRKSRLNTSLHLAPKMEISASDRHIIFKEGYLTLAKDRAYFTLRNGQLNQFQNENEVEMLNQAQEIPIRSYDVSNSFVRTDTDKKILTVLLLEDEQQLKFVCDNQEDLLSWAKIITHISYRWGLVQKTEMEHELAGMRKQMGQLWDLCVDGIVPAKVQKRINDLTIEIALKDSLMADVIARQDELSVLEIQTRKHQKVDLFPAEEPVNIESQEKETSLKESDSDDNDNENASESPFDSNEGFETGSNEIVPLKGEQVNLNVKENDCSIVALKEEVKSEMRKPEVISQPLQDTSVIEITTKDTVHLLNIETIKPGPLEDSVPVPSLAFTESGNQDKTERASLDAQNVVVEAKEVIAESNTNEIHSVSLENDLAQQAQKEPNEQQEKDTRINNQAQTEPEIQNDPIESVLTVIGEAQESVKRKISLIQVAATDVVSETQAVEKQEVIPNSNVQELDQLLVSCIVSLEGRMSRRPSNRQVSVLLSNEGGSRPSSRRTSRSRDAQGSIENLNVQSTIEKIGKLGSRTNLDAIAKAIVTSNEGGSRPSSRRPSRSRDAQVSTENLNAQPTIGKLGSGTNLDTISKAIVFSNQGGSRPSSRRPSRSRDAQVSIENLNAQPTNLEKIGKLGSRTNLDTIVKAIVTSNEGGSHPSSRRPSRSSKPQQENTETNSNNSISVVQEKEIEPSQNPVAPEQHMISSLQRDASDSFKENSNGTSEQSKPFSQKQELTAIADNINGPEEKRSEFQREIPVPIKAQSIIESTEKLNLSKPAPVLEKKESFTTKNGRFLGQTEAGRVLSSETQPTAVDNPSQIKVSLPASVKIVPIRKDLPKVPVSVAPAPKLELKPRDRSATMAHASVAPVLLKTSSYKENSPSAGSNSNLSSAPVLPKKSKRAEPLASEQLNETGSFQKEVNSSTTSVEQIIAPSQTQNANENPISAAIPVASSSQKPSFTLQKSSSKESINDNSTVPKSTAPPVKIVFKAPVLIKKKPDPVQ